MNRHILLLLALGVMMAGCQATGSKGPAKDSAVDTRLSSGGLSESAPAAGPAEPQQGFSQEVREAQNP